MTMPILITGSIYDVTKSSGELLVISTALHRYSQKDNYCTYQFLCMKTPKTSVTKKYKKTSFLGKDVFLYKP